MQIPWLLREREIWDYYIHLWHIKVDGLKYSCYKFGKKESTISKFLGYMIEYITIQGKTNSSCARIPERSIHTIASNPANPELLCAKQPSRQHHNHSTQFQQSILVQIETLLAFQTRWYSRTYIQNYSKSCQANVSDMFSKYCYPSISKQQSMWQVLLNLKYYQLKVGDQQQFPGVPMSISSSQLPHVTLNLPPPTYVGTQLPALHPSHRTSSSGLGLGWAQLDSSDFERFALELRRQEAESPACYVR